MGGWRRAALGITGALLRTLNETNQALLPELIQLQQKVAHSQLAQQTRTSAKAPPLEIEGLPELD